MFAVGRSGFRGSDVSLALVGIVAGGLVGVAFALSPRLGTVLLIGALGLLCMVFRPGLIAVVALAGVLAAPRLGASSAAPGAAGGIAYSDAVLTLAAVIAVPLLLRTVQLRRLRVVLIGLAVYLGCLLPTVLLHLSERGIAEWTHRLVLVGGSLLVGAWIARDGTVRLALRALTGVATAVAVVAVVDAVRSGFEPAYPLQLNKNFVGAVLGAVLVVLLVAPKAPALDGRVRVLVVAVLGAGLFAVQSRGSMLGVVAGLLVAFVLDLRAHGRRARVAAAFVAIVFLCFVYLSVGDQLDQATPELNNNSIGVRRNVERVTLDIWRTEPLTGVGLKYFNVGGYGQFAQPSNNAVDNELAESGVIGLLGFVVLQGGAALAAVRRRRGDPLVLACFGCVVGALVHGMVDIYWIAGSASLPFLLLGIALGREPARRPAYPTAPLVRARPVDAAS